MRARDFLTEDKTVTINIPINITIPSGGGDPQVSTTAIDPKEAVYNKGELPEDPVWVFPGQQLLELEKHKSGKRSTVLNQILDNNGADSEYGPQDGFGDEAGNPAHINEDKTVYDLSSDFDELTKVYESAQQK